MSGNYNRFLQVLQKWPINSLDDQCYGLYLRSLLKKTPINFNVFPGSEAENTKQINSLVRLSENKWSKQYPYNGKSACTGLTLQELEKSMNRFFVKK